MGRFLSRKQLMFWLDYDACSICSAAPGQPCLDRRFTRFRHTPADKPHRGRKKLPHMKKQR